MTRRPWRPLHRASGLRPLLALPRTALAGLVLLLAAAEWKCVHADLPREGGKDLRSSRKIDEHVNAELKRRQFMPAKDAEDAEFLRRLSLDLTGTIPPAEEVVSFLKDRDPKKREMKIDEYINHPLFAENLAVIWANLLLSRSSEASDRGMMENYLRDCFITNKPYDAMVRELLVAEGTTDEVAEVNYLVRHAEAAEAAGHTARVFLGLQIQCAQCHNHPYEKWEQKDFWGYTAFFIRMQRRQEGMRGDAYRPYSLSEATSSEVRYQVRGIPGSGQNSGEPVFDTAAPRFLGTEVASDSLHNRRESLARIMTDPQNLRFARAIVNRVWSHLLGRGLVMPVDDMGENNPPTHPELLDLLADDLIKKGYDLKYLYRVIANSKAYQRSSEPRNARFEGAEYYAYANMKPMTPEQLFNSLMQATGMDEKQRFHHPGRLREWKNNYLASYIYNFGNDEEEVIESFQGTIPQSLLMMNGPMVAEGVRVDAGSNLDRLFKLRKSDDDRVELMFLASLSRRPTALEKKGILDSIHRKGPTPDQRKEGFEDAFWALLNTTEFIYVH
ncbi:MAG: DUF1553 domain-containing protein [Planctomycetes bacterium]|nr:DUF1553 domain-containing protein [Planctomycetota bacterium]